MTGEITLRETDLLLIQNVLKGNNSGLDFGRFRDPGVNTASYRGNRSESLDDSPVLDPAKEGGRITQVRFYYTYNDGTGDRLIQIRAYSDGHVSTTKPSQPDLLNRVETCIYYINTYEKFLTPFDDLLTQFVPKKYSGSLHSPEDEYRRKAKAAFGNLVDEYVDDDRYEGEEEKLFISIIANIGIEFISLSLSEDQYPSPPNDDSFPQNEGRVRDFFDDYAKYEKGLTDSGFDLLWNHLRWTLTKDYENPVELIEDTIETYDLDG